MKLRYKILLLLMPLLVLPMLGLGWIAYKKLRDTAEQKTLNQMTTLINQIELQLSSFMETSKSNIDLFSTTEMIKKYIMTEDEAQRFQVLQPSILRLFGGYQNAYPNYYEIRLLLPDGYEDTRATVGYIHNKTEEEKNTPYFIRMSTSKNDIYSEFFINPDTGGPAFFISKRIAIKNSNIDPILAKPKLYGYMTLTIDISFLAQQETQNSIGKGGQIFFVDNNGNRLFNSKNEKTPKQLFGTRQVFEIIRKLSSRQIFYSKLGQEFSIFQGAKLANNLYVIAALPEEEMVQRSRELGLWIALFTIMTTLIIAFLLYVVLNKLIIYPIQHLAVC